VSLVDDARQYFPGMTGLDGIAAAERGTPLAQSFCQHVVAAGASLVVVDAAARPLVRESAARTQLGVVAYAGVPLTTAAGETLGAVCAIDHAPRAWTDDDVEALRDLALSAMSEIELRTALRALAERQALLEAAQARLVEQATHDELPGLLNRRGFLEQARRPLAVATRAGTPCFLVNVDLDGFKSINDSLGHEVGDVALVEMAAVLQRTFRMGDLVARIGGDEFVMLAANGGVESATVACERLRRALDERNGRPDRSYVLAASVGMVVGDPAAPTTLSELLHAADQAMFADKRQRRAPT
jgi:diguanylate cyclase (GGDEF)-like protein